MTQITEYSGINLLLSDDIGRPVSSFSGISLSSTDIFPSTEYSGINLSIVTNLFICTVDLLTQTPVLASIEIVNNTDSSDLYTNGVTDSNNSENSFIVDNVSDITIIVSSAGYLTKTINLIGIDPNQINKEIVQLEVDAPEFKKDVEIPFDFGEWFPGRDLLIYEDGNGGDTVKIGNDFRMTNSIYNQIYLAWFGGNIAESHEDPEDTPNGSQSFDYWQNNLFYPDQFDLHLNSRVERTLKNISLTPQGIYELESIASEDLGFLNKFGNVTVEVEVNNVDNIVLTARIEQIEDETDILVNFVFDATKKEIIKTEWL